MPTQFHLPTPPGNAQEINSVVAIVRERGQVAYFASGVPVFTHAEDDAAGQRIAAVQLIELGLAQAENGDGDPQQPLHAPHQPRRERDAARLRAHGHADQQGDDEGRERESPGDAPHAGLGEHRRRGYARRQRHAGNESSGKCALSPVAEA